MKKAVSESINNRNAEISSVYKTKLAITVESRICFLGDHTIISLFCIVFDDIHDLSMKCSIPL